MSVSKLQYTSVFGLKKADKQIFEYILFHTVGHYFIDFFFMPNR